MVIAPSAAMVERGSIAGSGPFVLWPWRALDHAATAAAAAAKRAHLKDFPLNE